MAEENDETDLNPRLLSDNVLKSVTLCSQDLGRLQEKLQPKTRHKTMSRVGLRALKWPLSKSSVNEEVKMIKGYLAIFNTALHLGHIAISQGIDLKIDHSPMARSYGHKSDAKGRAYLGGKEKDQYRGSVRGSPSGVCGLFRLHPFSWF